MTYSFYLAYPNAEKSAIMVAIRDKQSRITASTGILLSPKDWDKELSKPKKGCEDYKAILAKLLNFETSLKAILKAAEREDAPLSKIKETLTGKKVPLKKKVSRAGEYIPFMEFFHYWSENRINNHTPYRQHKQSYNLIKEFCGPTQIDYEDINYNFYTEFIGWCRKGKSYKENTIGTHIRNIKAVMSEAAKRAYHNNTAYLAFSKPKEDIDSVYLTEEEIERLYRLPLTGLQAAVRDLFLIGCYTALRYSDYSSLTLWDISAGYIVKRTQKTQASVTIPIHPRVRDILHKYNGSPKVNISTLNQQIKTICLAAEIREKVAVTNNRHTTYREKWELVSSHTARRTGATNMFLAGIPPLSIMKITGHKSEKVFLNYIKITNLENAKLLQNNSFFIDSKAE